MRPPLIEPDLCAALSSSALGWISVRSQSLCWRHGRPIFTIIILYFFAVVEGKGLPFAENQVKTELGGILIKNW